MNLNGMKKQNFQEVDESSMDTDRLGFCNKETNGIERMPEKQMYANMDI